MHYTEIPTSYIIDNGFHLTHTTCRWRVTDGQKDEWISVYIYIYIYIYLTAIGLLPGGSFYKRTYIQQGNST
jgi:hypothetical protein